MYDTISIGSALVDIFVVSDHFKLRKSQDGVLLCEQYGEKVEIDNFVVETGGGGGNTAVGFARMGFQSAVVTELGKDTWSRVILDNFHEERVATNLVISEKKEQTGGSVILVGSDGGRTVMVHRGASSLLDKADIPRQQLEHARWIHLSSIGGRQEALSSIFRAVKNSATELSWNPGKKELELLLDGTLRISECKCRVFIVNAREWRMLDWVQKEVVAAVQQVVITDGARGGQVITDGSVTPFTAQGVQSVDDTGAGDAFSVGYVSALLYGKEATTAANWGVLNASSVIQRIGAKPGLLRKSQL